MISNEEGVPTPANLLENQQEEEPTQEYYAAEYYYPTYDYSGEAWNPNPYTFTPCYPAYYPYNFNEYCYDETYLYYEGDPNYGCNYSWGSGEISAEELSEELESGDVRPAVKVESYKMQKPVEKKAPRGPRPPRQSNRGKGSKSKKGKQPSEQVKKYHEAPNYSRPKVHYRQVIPKVENEKVAPLCIGIPEVAGAMWADVDPDEEMDFSVSVYGNQS